MLLPGFPFISAFTPEEVAAGRLLESALHDAHVTAKVAAISMGISESEISRWFTGERGVQWPKLWKLPKHARQEVAEQWGIAEDLPIIPRATWATVARLLHLRPRPARARYLAAEKETSRVA